MKKKPSKAAVENARNGRLVHWNIHLHNMWTPLRCRNWTQRSYAKSQVLTSDSTHSSSTGESTVVGDSALNYIIKDMLPKSSPLGLDTRELPDNERSRSEHDIVPVMV